MKSFILNQDKKIIIYGAGGNANRIISFFNKTNYEIVAILDKRAAVIHDMGEIPVYTLEDFAQKNKEKEQYVILVTIKNVFEHINIVRNLMDYGYENIIYKPYAILQGEHDDEWDSIDFAYESLIEKGQWLDEEHKVVAKTRKNHLMVYKDELCIEKKDKISCWLPVELVCNYNNEEPFGLVPMAAFYPMVNIYQYLLNNEKMCTWEEICEDYLRYTGDWIYKNGKDFTLSLKKNMINSRVDIFGEMQRKADLDKQFFVRNRITVERKEEAFFYLTASGRNRASFLIAKGYRYIPAEMSIDNYLKWMNEEGFQKFRQYLEKKKISKLFTSIPHPMFATFPTETVDYMHLFCLPVISAIYRYLHKYSTKSNNGYEMIDNEKYKELRANTRIGIAMKDDGCMARLMRIYGFNSKRYIVNSEQNEISNQIDELLLLTKESENQLCVSAEKLISESDILIIDSRLQKLPMDLFSGKKIFWLQWENDELDRNVRNQFSSEKQIFKSVWMKKMVFGWMLE